MRSKSADTESVFDVTALQHVSRA